MAEEIKLNKSVFNKKAYLKTIDTSFKELGVKTILMGFGLDSDAIHSPNEHFGLSNFYNGIETIANFYKLYSQ